MDKLFIFGGFTSGDALNDMHVLDVKSIIWSSELFGRSTKPRQYATSIRHGGKILVTGGCDFAKVCFNDMFELVEIQILEGPSSCRTRAIHLEGFTLTVVRNRVFLVGGCFLTHRCFGGERSPSWLPIMRPDGDVVETTVRDVRNAAQMSRNTKLARARTQVRVTACVDTVYVCVFRVSWVLTVQKDDLSQIVFETTVVRRRENVCARWDSVVTIARTRDLSRVLFRSRPVSSGWSM